MKCKYLHLRRPGFTANIYKHFPCWTNDLLLVFPSGGKPKPISSSIHYRHTFKQLKYTKLCVSNIHRRQIAHLGRICLQSFPSGGTWPIPICRVNRGIHLNRNIYTASTVFYIYLFFFRAKSGNKATAACIFYRRTFIISKITINTFFWT